MWKWKHFKISLEIFFDPWWFEVCNLIFIYLGTFQKSFYFDFWFNYTVVWEQWLYDFYSFNFVKVCFMAQNIVCLGTLLGELEKNIYFVVLGRSRLLMSSWLMVLLSLILSLLIFCLLKLSIFDREMLKSPGIIVDWGVPGWLSL